MPIATKSLQDSQSLGAPFLPGIGIGKEEPGQNLWNPEEPGKMKCGKAPVQSCTTQMRFTGRSTRSQARRIWLSSPHTEDN